MSAVIAWFVLGYVACACIAYAAIAVLVLRMRSAASARRRPEQAVAATEDGTKALAHTAP